MSRSTNQEDFPLLETKRLVLRQMRPGDAEAIFRIYGDEEVMRYRDVLPFTRPEEAQQFLEGVHARYQQGEEMHWAITLKGEDFLMCVPLSPMVGGGLPGLAQISVRGGCAWKRSTCSPQERAASGCLFEATSHNQ